MIQQVWILYRIEYRILTFLINDGFTVTFEYKSGNKGGIGRYWSFQRVNSGDSGGFFVGLAVDDYPDRASRFEEGKQFNLV